MEVTVKETAVKTSNGRIISTRVHVSKRGKTYKRRRVVASDIKAPRWWSR